MLRRFTCATVAMLVASGVALAEPAKPRMRKGPYLQDLAPSSITVMWQLDEPRPAKLDVTGPGGGRTLEFAAANIAEARVDRLVPSSRYKYRVEVGGESWAGEFA